MPNLFVFDLDDTLLYNKHNYSWPILESVRLILTTVGHRAPAVSALVALENQIDLARVKEIDPTTGKPYLYNRRRFPGSLVATYERVCQDAAIPAKQEIKDRLLAIGEYAFAPEQYQQNIVPGAEQVLKFLADQDNLLVLCTKGDFDVQWDKLNILNELNILRHFTDVKVVDQKNTATFADIKNSHRQCTHAYTVGNMYKGDILPALAVCYKGIYIPDEHWETHGDKEKASLEIDPASVIILDSLGQLIDRYGELP